jgi:hypothetical protein
MIPATAHIAIARRITRMHDAVQLMPMPIGFLRVSA